MGKALCLTCRDSGGRSLTSKEGRLFALELAVVNGTARGTTAAVAHFIYCPNGKKTRARSLLLEGNRKFYWGHYQLGPHKTNEFLFLLTALSFLRKLVIIGRHCLLPSSQVFSSLVNSSRFRNLSCSGISVIPPWEQGGNRPHPSPLQLHAGQPSGALWVSQGGDWAPPALSLQRALSTAAFVYPSKLAFLIFCLLAGCSFLPWSCLMWGFPISLAR